MKDVLIITHFSFDLGRKGNGRFDYIAELLLNEEVNVELVTSSFSHSHKKKREAVETGSERFKVTFIEEPSYMKNVSMRRLYCHHVMASNLMKYLESRSKPDVIYCAFPPINTARVAAEYAKANHIRLIIDIQDLWPEAFRMFTSLSIIDKMIFEPMKKKAQKIYQSADEIIAVSDTYLQVALSACDNRKKGKVVFLGTNLNTFDQALLHGKEMEKSGEELWIGYIGNLSHSNDINSIIDALAMLDDKFHNKVKFIIMGDGPLEDSFKEYAKKRNVSTLFTGRLPYVQMVAMLGLCDIAVNPISKGCTGSIINKVGDYASASLPVINTQECMEYRNLIEEYNAGYNCLNGDPDDISKKLALLLEDQGKRIEMGRNNRTLAENRFDRRQTYLHILDSIMETN